MHDLKRRHSADIAKAPAQFLSTCGPIPSMPWIQIDIIAVQKFINP